MRRKVIGFYKERDKTRPITAPSFTPRVVRPNINAKEKMWVKFNGGAEATLYPNPDYYVGKLEVKDWQSVFKAYADPKTPKVIISGHSDILGPTLTISTEVEKEGQMVDKASIEFAGTRTEIRAWMKKLTQTFTPEELYQVVTTDPHKVEEVLGTKAWKI